MEQANSLGTPATSGTRDNRRDEREDVFLKTIISKGVETSSPAELVNISMSGFLVRNTAEANKEDRVRISLPFVGDEPAVVRWSLAGCMGCEFIYPIDERDFPRLLAAIRRAGENWLNDKAN